MGNVVAIRKADSHSWAGQRRGKDAIEIREFFQGHEATIGFSSSFGGMEAALSGLAVHDPFANPYEYLLASVWSDQRPTMGRAVWRALRLLDASDRVVLFVLYRLYGGAARLSPNVLSALGEEIGKVARFTDAASRVRDDLAFSRSSIRSEIVRANFEQVNADTLNASSDLFWTELAPVWEALTVRLAKLRTLPFSPRVERQIDRLECKIEKLWEKMDSVAYTEPADPLPAVLTSISSADAETSIDEAVSHALLTFKDAKRAEFISDVKRQGQAVIDLAMVSYRAARESGT